MPGYHTRDRGQGLTRKSTRTGLVGDDPGASRGMNHPTNQPMSQANKEGPRVKQPFNASNDLQSFTQKYCDRCARRSRALLYDDLTLQELCQDCCDRLRRRREVASSPATTGR